MEVLAALVDRIEAILETRSFYEVWLRAARPHDGGVLFVREKAGGTLLAYDHARVEAFSSPDRFEVWEWLNERAFRRVGCFVEEHAGG